MKAVTWQGRRGLLPDMLARKVTDFAGVDRLVGVETFATQRLPLAAAPDAYRMFQTKSDGAVKIVLDPR